MSPTLSDCRRSNARRCGSGPAEIVRLVDAIGPRYRALVLLLSLWLSAVQIPD
jgi:hypothetical protein